MKGVSHLADTREDCARKADRIEALGSLPRTWWETGDVGQHSWAMETHDPNGKVKSKLARVDLETS